MSLKKILITGVGGFIGSRLLTCLDQSKFEIDGLGMHGLPQHLAGMVKKFYPVDISRPFTLNENYDCVIHLSALNVTHVDKAENDSYDRVNVAGTENLIKAVKTKRFVFMSTAKVYKLINGSVAEQSEALPINGYEKSKFQAEQVIERLCPPGTFVILRAANVVGPGQALKAVMPVIIDRALKNLTIDIFAPRNTRLHLLYIDDLIEAIVSIVDKQEIQGIFNLAGNESIALEDLVKRVIIQTKSCSKVKYSNIDRGIEMDIDTSKIKSQLGWSAKHEVDQIIQNCIKGLACK